MKRLMAAAALALLASCGDDSEGPKDPFPTPDTVFLKLKNLDATSYRLWIGTHDPTTDHWTYQSIWNPTYVGPSQLVVEGSVELVPTSPTAKHYFLVYNLNNFFVSQTGEYVKNPGTVTQGVHIAGGFVGFFTPVPTP